MKYRTLGRTKLCVSVVGLGTWQFGGEWGKDYTDSEAAAVIATAAERGINVIDTAECYGDHLSESLIGRAIAGKRQQWIIASKFGHKYHDFMERTRHFSGKDITEQLEASLRALRTDYIDLYQLHSATDEEFGRDDIWETLNREKGKGKIRHIGLSISPNTNIFQTEKALEVGAEVIQVVYNRLEHGPETEVFPACQKHTLGVLSRVPLASGYLSGKYSPGAKFENNDVRSRHDPEHTANLLREVANIAKNEVPAETDMVQWALAWCLRNEAVTAVIPGSKNPQQVIQNAHAADLVTDDHPYACSSPSNREQ